MPFSAGVKCSAPEFMQYLIPVGSGPSSNACPRCPPHLPHTTSVRLMPNLLSDLASTATSITGLKKLGQPVPESNFVSDEKSSFPQPAQV